VREVDRLVSVLSSSPDTTVLLLGESGTGKGVTAELIHRRSPRRDKPFQEINCAGLSETFLESELFGAERGAYTDAKSLKRGLLELADGGTVFLDEIGDLAPALQPKLLKVLEARRFRRLGGVKDLEVDVRLVAATNRDLKRMVEEGKFREDLYYRLNVMSVRMPPLRERGRDIVLLANRFVEQFNRSLGRKVAGLTPEAEGALLAHPWPGNVRELRNAIERAMILCQGDRIGREHLPHDLGGRPLGAVLPPAPASIAAAPPLVPPLVPLAGALGTLEEMERAYIAEALKRLDDNRSRTAQVLGISRSTLIEKIKKYGLGAAQGGEG
jgi:two-component system response regulator AtoC